jgi:hypothetical protein
MHKYINMSRDGYYKFWVEWECGLIVVYGRFLIMKGKVKSRMMAEKRACGLCFYRVYIVNHRVFESKSRAKNSSTLETMQSCVLEILSFLLQLFFLVILIREQHSIINLVFNSLLNLASLYGLLAFSSCILFFE